MPLDAQQRKDLESAIALGRKKELPFGICLGKKPDGTVWKVMKTKSPEVNGKLAKKDGETGQFTFGVMTVQSKNINLVLHGKMLPGIVKKLKAFLKAANIKMKVKIFDLEGSVLEADEEDEGAAPEAGGEAQSAPEPDPQQGKWKSVAAQVLKAIKKVKDTPGIDLKETTELWSVAVKQAEAGAYSKALTSVQQVAGLLKEAVVAAKQGDKLAAAQAKKWQGASAKLAPLVKHMMDGGFGDTGKINAVWMLAKSKAAATPPDYTTAFKAVGALTKLLAEAKAAMASAPVTAPATPEPAMAGGPAAPEPPHSGASVEGTSIGDAKLAEVERLIAVIEGLITAYNAIDPTSAEVIPPKWDSAVLGAKALIAPMKADPTKMDAGKLDTAVKALTMLQKTITDATAQKTAWKAALELFNIGLAPLDNHPQTADPKIKPTIDAIKADRDKAEAKAVAHDHTQAIKDLEALPARCVAAEALADDYSEWKVLDAPRMALAQTYLGTITGVATVDPLLRKMEDTYTQAAADAAVDKYKDAVAKLDLIPDMFKNCNIVFRAQANYNRQIATYDPLMVTINAKDAAVLAPVKTSLDEFNTRYAAAKFAVTADYEKSCVLLGDIGRVHTYLKAEIAAIEAWIAALKAFDLQLASFKAHAGNTGIQDIILEMERDRATALTEATANKHSTALAVLNRSQPNWAATTTIAQASAAYLAARKTAQDKIDALSGTPEAASLLEQANTMLGVAGTQAINKNFAAAKTTAEEAAKRADAAKDAADTQDAVAAMNNPTELDKLAKDWDAAYKVYTDIRAAVAAKDTSNTFDTFLATADAMAQKGKTAHDNGEFDDARMYLDTAISQLQSTLVIVLGHGPYVAHKTKVTGEITALTPLSIDDCLKPKIDAAKALLAEADALAKDPQFNFPPAETKLAEASKIATRATADAALYTGIKADRTIIASIQTAINAVNVAKNVMPKQLAALQKMLDDIDALVAAGKFGEAEQKAKIGAAMNAAITKDIITAQQCKMAEQSWHDDKIGGVSGPGNEAAATAVLKVGELLAVYKVLLADEAFDAAITSLSPVSWAIDACVVILQKAAIYAPLKAAADAKLNPLKANPSSAIAAELQKLVDSYQTAEAKAADDKYLTAQKIMATIPDACEKLAPINTAFLAFEPKQKAALAKLTELKAHAQAGSVAAMIERLQGKYDNAMAYADAGTYDTAQTMMQEITPATEEAIAAADRHGLLEATNELIAGDDESAPWWPQIAAAKAAITLVSMREHADVAKAKIDEGFAQCAEAEKDGQEDSTAKAALKAAFEACNAADEIISQYQFHLTEIDAARTLLATLGTHAQKDYIASDLAAMDTAIDAAAAKASTGSDIAGVSAGIEAVMTRYHASVLLADGYARYLDLRGQPEVEDRLTKLEEHAHRYAIKPSIDTMRAKLQKAADEIGARNPEAAIKLLEEIRALGTSAFVTAEMMANTPPSEDDLKKILARPGGADELDAIIDKLPEEAQRAVLKVAFKARYGCDIDNFNTASLTVPLPDGSQKGPNIKAFYQAMEDLPLADTLDNDAMQDFAIMDTKVGTSFYDGIKKQVVMDEGNAATSNTRHLGSTTEVEVTDDDCKLANDDPMDYFSWNTLHEVGHAVDDRDNYMDKNGKNDSHGGWVFYGANVKPIAEKIKSKYDYDLNYIVTYMAGNANPAIPEKPEAKACSDEEWDALRISVRDHVDIAREGRNPWASMGAAKKLAIDGVVYQESYANKWHSYKLSARGQGVTGYQFRAPGEWFSELYAAYHSGKLKPQHPAVKWLETL